MTCIVAIEKDGVVYVGGDSAGVDVDTLDIVRRADEKVFLSEGGDNDVIIGFAGSFRIGQLLRYALHVPDQPSRKNDMAYMVTDFVDAVRTMQKDKGSMTKENELEEHDGQFIVGYNGHLYIVYGDFQVERPVDSHAAIGCGMSYALGSLHSTRNSKKLSPEQRIRKALRAAAEYSAGVRPPFHVLKLEPEKE